MRFPEKQISLPFCFFRPALNKMNITTKILIDEQKLINQTGYIFSTSNKIRRAAIANDPVIYEDYDKQTGERRVKTISGGTEYRTYISNSKPSKVMPFSTKSSLAISGGMTQKPVIPSSAEGGKGTPGTPGGCSC